MIQTQRTILIVDDSPEDRETYRRYLLKDERYCYKIVEEEYGERGLQLSRSLHPDAILLDFSLPDIDGLEFLQELHAELDSTRPPVVMLTGQGSEEIAVAALKSGAQDYLVKDNTTPERLCFAVRGAIEQARLRQKLERSETRFRRLVESNIIGIVISELNGHITYANDAFLQMLGYGRGDVERGALNWYDLTPPEHRKTDREAIQQLQQFGTCQPREKEYWHKNGSRVPALLGGALLEEEPKRAISFVMDLSDRKAAELNMRKALEKEKELHELKSRFVSMVSHEFRNPLTTISGGVQMLLDYRDRIAPEKQQTILQHMQNGVQKMFDLLEDVLVIGRANAGKIEFRPASLTLEPFCRDLIEELQMGMGAKHPIAFVYQGEKIALVDRKLLRHILTNLLSNAFKYSLEGSPVRLEVDCQPGKAIFRIEDRGIGIPDRDLEKLFDSFHRASNVGNIPGTGLGLTIVKQCVELHGGSIAIESQVGAGTTIAIALPRGKNSKQ